MSSWIRASHDFGALLYLLAAHVQVGHQAEAPRPHGIEQHLSFSCASHHDIGPFPAELDVHDVRLRRHDLGDLSQLRGQVLRVDVVLLEVRPLVLQRVEGSRGEDASLPHTAAQHLAPAMRVLDLSAGASQGRAHRGSQSLGETHRNGVEGGSQSAHVEARGHAGVPETRAVEVRAQLKLTRARGDLEHLRLGEHAAASGVVSVLEGDEASARIVVVLRLDRGAKLRGIEQSASSRDGELHAAQRRSRTRLEPGAMGSLADDDFVSRLRGRLQCQLVGHRPGGHE